MPEFTDCAGKGSGLNPLLLAGADQRQFFGNGKIYNITFVHGIRIICFLAVPAKVPDKFVIFLFRCFCQMETFAMVSACRQQNKRGSAAYLRPGGV
jgi:hypothetical protein